MDLEAGRKGLGVQLAPTALARSRIPVMPTPGPAGVLLPATPCPLSTVSIRCVVSKRRVTAAAAPGAWRRTLVSDS
jgi:hypothetical protein